MNYQNNGLELCLHEPKRFDCLKMLISEISDSYNSMQLFMFIVTFDENFKISQYARKCPLRRYILGVLMHTTTWGQLWGADETLK